MEEKQYCTFYIDDMLLGIEVVKVREIIRAVEMTRVPLAHETIKGLINLRGQIVTAIDLRKKFELPERPEGQSFMNVIMNAGEDTVSFLVDRIGDVIEVAPRIYEPAPETLKGAARELICGAYKLADGLLLVIDAEKILGSGGNQRTACA